MLVIHQASESALPDLFSSSDAQVGLGEAIHWTDRQIALLRIVLLQSSLRQLSDRRASPDTQRDIRQWIGRNDDRNPFGFSVCMATFMAATGFYLREKAHAHYSPLSA